MGISREQALDCFNSDDLIGIGMEADAVRRRLHPEGVVSYGIEGEIACAGAGFEDVCEQVESAVELGCTGVVLPGGGAAGETIEGLEKLLAGVKERFPAVWVHGFSAGDVLAAARSGGLTVPDAIARLRDAGLDSIAGDDAEILDDAVQYRRDRLSCSAKEWLNVHRTAHGMGMRTTATMMFGGGETMEHRVNHLEALGRLQEETGGFTAFTPVAFQPQATGMQGFEEATAVEYLKTLAISRMYLDNIVNVQADLETQGLKVLQMGLRFGGNDVGSVKPEDAGSLNGATEEQLRQVIRDAGFRPVQRDTVYRTMFLN
jgi:cyclic dehypoxanthinyl futalosine synthase